MATRNKRMHKKEAGGLSSLRSSYCGRGLRRAVAQREPFMFGSKSQNFRRVFREVKKRFVFNSLSVRGDNRRRLKL